VSHLRKLSKKTNHKKTTTKKNLGGRENRRKERGVDFTDAFHEPSRRRGCGTYRGKKRGKKMGGTAELKLKREKEERDRDISSAEEAMWD